MYERILVPYDGSKASDQGLDEAIRLAKLTGAQLRVIHEIDEMAALTGFESYAAYSTELLAWLQQSGTAMLAKARAMATEAGVPVETELFRSLGSRLAERVAEQVAVWKAELVVIGSHGRRGAARLFLGSDAEQILRTSAVPVLLVRHQANAEGGPQ